MDPRFVFRSLAEALHQGFYVYDTTPEGYLLRRHRDNRWELALCVLQGEHYDPRD